MKKLNTLNKLATLLFTIVLGASLACAPALAYADIKHDDKVATQLSSSNYVVDNDELLTANQESTLNDMGATIAKDSQVGAYYVTVKSLDGYSDAQSYAEAFIDSYNLDSFNAKGSVLLVLCVPEGKFAIVSSGGAEATFNNEVLTHFVNEINPYLGRSDWLGAGETFFDDVTQTLAGKTANATSTVSYSGTYVTDNYGLFDANQRATLEAKATELAEKYKMGVYLLVVDKMNGLDNPSSTQRTNFATSFYRANNLGLGEGKDGIMLVLAIDSRDYVTIAYGQGSYSFSDEGVEAIEDAVKDELRDNNWYGGCTAYYDKVGDQLEYYAARGKPWKKPDILSLVLKILAIIAIPAAVASGRVRREKQAMTTAVEQHEASNYLDRDSFVLTASNDEFVNTTLAVTPRPKSESSGGGSSFGGGGWGGGGGGGFSSSGGGKF